LRSTGSDIPPLAAGSFILAIETVTSDLVFLPRNPAEGGMLSLEGQKYMLEQPWLAFWPGLALATVIYGINMLGDAMRDLLDPRLRGKVGRLGLPKNR
jgi:ABC-type dipeptide/oligopeptide/nickel transport system permease subunit